MIFADGGPCMPTGAAESRGQIPSHEDKVDMVLCVGVGHVPRPPGR